jgi:hypothetical protein
MNASFVRGPDGLGLTLRVSKGVAASYGVCAWKS